MLFTAIGILSAIIFVIADTSYLRDTLKSKTKPHRVTWGIVFLLNVIGFANQLASGASNSLWIFGAAVIMTGTIFIASIFKGVGGSSKLDIFSLITSLFGVGLWIVFDSPLLSIFANIIVAVISLLPTFKKAKEDPESETRIAWLLGAVSTALAAISVGSIDVQLLLLPVSSTMLQSYMVYLLYFRNKLAS